MLDTFLADEKAVERFRSSPLGAHLDSFVAAAASLGYARSTVREQLWVLGDLGRWLARTGVTVSHLDERLLRRFLVVRRRKGRCHRTEAVTVRRFLDHLREQSVLPPAEILHDDSPIALLQRRYETYLTQERGLAPATLATYGPLIHRFLKERFGNKPLRLESLGPSDISNFVLRRSAHWSVKRVQLMVSALRSFLRFLVQQGEIAIDLAACVPSVAHTQLATVPKHLSGQEVERLLDSCNRSTAVGRRDYAILLLLARLGLRAGEVVALELDDIHWKAGEIIVRGKGGIDDRLPLLRDIGEALVAYLYQDRTCSQSRHVFIRMRSPRHGFGGSGAVSTIVRRALQRVGLQPPIKGAHLLRHSLATQMLGCGGSLAEIAEVLRHRSQQTTEIYAKVDIAGLRGLAHPWPDDGGGR